MVNVVLRCANAKSQTQKNCPTLQVPEDERLARLQLNADRGDRHVVTRLGLEFLLMRVAVAVVAMLALPMVVVAFRMILMIMMVVVVFFEEFGVEIQRFFERKTIDVDQILRIHLSVLALEMVGELGNSKQCCRHVCIKRNPAGGHDCMIWLQSPGTTA